MPPASKPMYDLQLVEGRLETENATLHSIEQRLKSSPELDRARKELDRTNADLDAVRASLRRLEAEAEVSAAKAKKFTATLYGGSIHDSREMASMEAEIQHAKTRQSQLEDQEIELMERLDTLESKVSETSFLIERLVTQREGSLEGLRDDHTRLKDAVEQLREERDATRKNLEPSILAIYDRLQQRAGHAVSLVEGGICQWCRVQIPPKDVQHARGDTIVTCNNCGRVLYAE